MFKSVSFLALHGAAACTERDLPTTALPRPPAVAPGSATSARERLAERLAVALQDPAVRASLKRRLDGSRAPEQKLQFQALARIDQTALVAAMARGGSNVADILADLTEARGLEIYLPVESHRRAWDGGDAILVATMGSDADTPVAFDTRGTRHTLDRSRPPATPVIALVPQETDFTGGRPELAVSCWDLCSGDPGGTGAGGGGGASTAATAVSPDLQPLEDAHEAGSGQPNTIPRYSVDGPGNSEQLGARLQRAGLHLRQKSLMERS